MDKLNFGEAIAALKSGKLVAREGWNGKGMFLILIKYSSSIDAEKHAHYHLHNVDYKGVSWLGMKTADDMFVPWLASQADILAEDWVVLE